MSNEQLIQEWHAQFNEKLIILDPHENPYVSALEERL
jgi:hypothetical protein